MKFITEDGKIAEGIPLTNEQVRQRENLVAYFHKEACRNGYHAYRDTKQCETLANAFVTGGILAAANKQPEPEPAVEAAPEPPVAEVPATVEKEELSF